MGGTSIRITAFVGKKKKKKDRERETKKYHMATPLHGPLFLGCFRNMSILKTTHKRPCLAAALPMPRDGSKESIMRWMKLEPIIQSEVSQKDKDHYSILMHIYGI